MVDTNLKTTESQIHRVGMTFRAQTDQVSTYS